MREPLRVPRKKRDQELIALTERATGASRPAVGLSATAEELLARPSLRGSAAVMTTANVDEGAADEDSVSHEMLRGMPRRMSLRRAMAAEAALERERQHSSLVQLGVPPAAFAGRREAALIANHTYSERPFSPLMNATRDARDMQKRLARSRYGCRHHEDQRGIEIGNVFTAALTAAGDGDAVFLYYVGHGLEDGMVGVGPFTAADPSQPGQTRRPDLAPYAPVVAEIEAAAGRGAHVTFIADTCHAGTATQIVRTHALERLSRRADPRLTAIKRQIARLTEIKGRLHQSLKDETYWPMVLRPQLIEVAVYLAFAGIEVFVPPETVPLNHYLTAAHHIDRTIDALFELAPRVEQGARSMLDDLP